MEKYLSQLCQLVVTRPRTSLEEVIVHLCSSSLRIAVKVPRPLPAKLCSSCWQLLVACAGMRIACFRGSKRSFSANSLVSQTYGKGNYCQAHSLTTLHCLFKQCLQFVRAVHCAGVLVAACHQARSAQKYLCSRAAGQMRTSCFGRLMGKACHSRPSPDQLCIGHSCCLAG